MTDEPTCYAISAPSLLCDRCGARCETLLCTERTTGQVWVCLSCYDSP